MGYALTDGKIKNIIRTAQKAMAEGLDEVIKPGLTSKGSRYRKAYFTYPSVEGISHIGSLLKGQLLLEINSFGNPFPYTKERVDSFIHNYLSANGLTDIIEEFNLGVFEINVLDKRTTLTEKLVSLFRFSLSDNPISDISAKIRHFYDLHYLMQDTDCMAYVTSNEFREAFDMLLRHDRKLFAQPEGWQKKPIGESPLIKDFDSVWAILSNKYNTELPSLAYTQIPSSANVSQSIKQLINCLF